MQYFETYPLNQARKLSERKLYAYTGMSEKWGLSYTNQEKKGANHIPCNAEKAAIRHAHPYFAIYRKLAPPTPPPPPPPPPRALTAFDTFQKSAFRLALYTEEVNLQTFVMIQRKKFWRNYLYT